MNEITYTFVEVSEERVNMGLQTVYVCDPEGRIDLICPCGCKERIILNSLPDAKPCWKVIGNSILPSINRLVGCRSHFTITGGVVTMHK